MCFSKNYTYENVNMIKNLKVHFLPFFLCLYPWLFKKMFVKLEVGKRFQDFHNEITNKIHALWKYIDNGNWD